MNVVDAVCENCGAPIRWLSGTPRLCDHELTPRETEVFVLLAQGFTNREIATTLVLAEGTVEWYVHSIFRKLGLHNRFQAISYAFRHHIFE